jgi:glycosyltransferase involved in cell wall biosynthesis
MPQKETQPHHLKIKSKTNLKPLKIHFDNQIFTLQKYGGISRYFTRLVQGLQDLGQAPRVLGGVYTNAYLSELEKELVKGIHFKKYPKKGLKALFKVGDFYNNTSQIWNNPDIVHETYFEFEPVLKGKPKARVTSTYDALNENFPELFPSNQLKTKEKQASFDRSDLIFSISHQTKRDMLEHFNVKEEKIKVVHLASDPPIPAHQIEYPKDIKRPFFLFVGIRMAHKNFDGFIKAFSASPQLMKEFDIVSIAHFGFSTKERNEFRILGFREDQIRHIKADDRLLAGYYSTALALVYPSLYEGFGIPPSEAMAYGCPVVCTNSSSLPEVVGEAAESFNPSDQEEFRIALENVAFDTSRREELIKKGREQVEKFSWEKMAKEHLYWYQNWFKVF